MINKKEEVIKCDECGLDFIRTTVYEITNAEGRRLYPYSCPYCNKSYNIKLRGNESIEINKRDFVDLKSPVPINSTTFHKIIEFYLFNCPARTTIKRKVPGSEHDYEFLHSRTCKRGKTFQERGIQGYGLIRLRKAMIAVSENGEMYECNLKSDIEKETERNGELCVILKNENMSQTDQIFYCIRNGLAHGSFSYSNGVYCFENFDKGKLKGRIRVKEKTLLNWIELCSMNIEEIKAIAKGEKQLRNN